MQSEAMRRELLELILAVSFRRERVTLASGAQSDFYLDLRQTLMRPRGIALAGELVLECLRAGAAVDAVGGMAVGAVPLIAAVLAAADRDPGPPLVGFFVRKQRKEHGLARQIEGAFAAGQNVALLEDTVTTGGSTLQALDVVEAAGASVSRVICLVDREEGARQAFAARGISLEALYARKDLPV
ncbi:MAG: orotate phosphoribosyltransferase [Myxococcales bacterium]|nr:orotate phosphoribosyltransferase [Myxococcales bacterium]MDH5566420.1 orotate phosphoribosyltransferase [Myxococcales bacterium]